MIPVNTPLIIVIVFVVLSISWCAWEVYTYSDHGRKFTERNSYRVAPFLIKVKNIKIIKNPDTKEYHIVKGWVNYRYLNGANWCAYPYTYKNFGKIGQLWKNRSTLG